MVVYRAPDTPADKMIDSIDNVKIVGRPGRGTE